MATSTPATPDSCVAGTSCPAQVRDEGCSAEKLSQGLVVQEEDARGAALLGADAGSPRGTGLGHYPIRVIGRVRPGSIVQ